MIMAPFRSKKELLFPTAPLSAFGVAFLLQKLFRAGL
jgi:hypothetical protein